MSRKLRLRSACLEESQQSDREVVEGRNVQEIFGSAKQCLSAKWKTSRTAENFKMLFPWLLTRYKLWRLGKNFSNFF